MKSGDTLVLFIDKIAPKFKADYNDNSTFPSDKVFDFQNWRKTENYKKIVTADEDQDNFGNKGRFEMSDDFTLVVLSTQTDEEEVQNVIANMTQLASFEIIKVQ